MIALLLTDSPTQEVTGRLCFLTLTDPHVLEVELMDLQDEVDGRCEDGDY